jgi:hypothetical protein
MKRNHNITRRSLVKTVGSVVAIGSGLSGISKATEGEAKEDPVFETEVEDLKVKDRRGAKPEIKIRQSDHGVVFEEGVSSNALKKEKLSISNNGGSKITVEVDVDGEKFDRTVTKNQLTPYSGVYITISEQRGIKIQTRSV